MSVSFQGSVCVFACASCISNTFLNFVKIWLCPTASLHLGCVLLLLIESSVTALGTDPTSAIPITQHNDTQANCTSCKYGRVSKTELWLDLNAEISKSGNYYLCKIIGKCYWCLFTVCITGKEPDTQYIAFPHSLVIMVMVSV